jgi:hypothetical protein
MLVRRLKAMQDVLDKMRVDRNSSSSYQEPLPLQCEPQAAEYLGVTPTGPSGLALSGWWPALRSHFGTRHQVPSMRSRRVDLGEIV